MPQLLITARDYLVHRFKCCSDADLLRAATEDHHEFEATFNYNWWVRLDKSDFCPVDVYMQDEIWDLHQESSEKTVAYQKYGINITVARHYVRRGQPLEFPTLPPIVFKALEHKRVWYLPLEKLYLHPHRARHLYEKFEDLLGIMVDKDGRVVSKRIEERTRIATARCFNWGSAPEDLDEPALCTLGSTCTSTNQPDLIHRD